MAVLIRLLYLRGNFLPGCRSAPVSIGVSLKLTLWYTLWRKSKLCTKTSAFNIFHTVKLTLRELQHTYDEREHKPFFFFFTALLCRICLMTNALQCIYLIIFWLLKLFMSKLLITMNRGGRILSCSHSARSLGRKQVFEEFAGNFIYKSWHIFLFCVEATL